MGQIGFDRYSYGIEVKLAGSVSERKDIRRDDRVDRMCYGVTEDMKTVEKCIALVVES